MTETNILDFNEIYNRPPNFCNDCGDLLDFEIITEDSILCSRCGGTMPIDVITNHLIETRDTYSTSKQWKNKLENKEDKLRASQKLIRPTVRIKV